jgi:hypothetical protein
MKMTEQLKIYFLDKKHAICEHLDVVLTDEENFVLYTPRHGSLYRHISGESAPNFKLRQPYGGKPELKPGDQVVMECLKETSRWYSLKPHPDLPKIISIVETTKEDITPKLLEFESRMPERRREAGKISQEYDFRIAELRNEKDTRLEELHDFYSLGNLLKRHYSGE